MKYHRVKLTILVRPATAYVSLQEGRKAIGIELKPSYFQQAVKNCKNAVVEDQTSLFD